LVKQSGVLGKARSATLWAAASKKVPIPEDSTVIGSYKPTSPGAVTIICLEFFLLFWELLEVLNGFKSCLSSKVKQVK
jgi:hypothetical protein